MKKVISLFLVLALLTAVLAVSFNALSVSDVDEETGEPFVMSAKEGIALYEEENEMEPGSLGTQRIYFMMPNGNNGPVATEDVNLHHPEELDPDTGEVVKEAYDEVVIHEGEKATSWYNENNILNGKHYAGVYWFGGPANVDGKWVGYRMEIDNEEQGIYYADIPYDPDDDDASVALAIFNNGVDGGTDSSKPIYYQAAQTIDTNIQGAFVGDYESLPYGSPDAYSFDRCIYVIDPNQVSINAYSNKQTCGANWYVYYGNGCYGEEFTDGADYSDYQETPGWTEDIASICKNPDHFDENGNHVGYQAPDPTEAPKPTDAPATEAPTEAPKPTDPPETIAPTEAPTDPPVTEAPTEAHTHTLKFKPGKKATATADGWKSYFYCTECGKYFSDSTGNIELTWDQIVLHYVAPTEAPTDPPATEAPTTPPATEPADKGILGDADGNSKVDIIDVTFIQRVLANSIAKTDAIQTRGDIDGNGTLEAIDATLLQRWLVDVPMSYKIGEKIK